MNSNDEIPNYFRFFSELPTVLNHDLTESGTVLLIFAPLRKTNIWLIKSYDNFYDLNLNFPCWVFSVFGITVNVKETREHMFQENIFGSSIISYL
mgnify:CR=1 FL=1